MLSVSPRPSLESALVLDELAVGLAQRLWMPPRPSLESAVVLEELAVGPLHQVDRRHILQVKVAEVHGRQVCQCRGQELRQEQKPWIHQPGAFVKVVLLGLRQVEVREVEHAGPHSRERLERKEEQESPGEPSGQPEARPHLQSAAARQ